MTAPAPRRRLTLAAALLAGTALAAGAVGWPAVAEQATPPIAVAPTAPIAVAPAAPQALLPSFADLAARVRPAVVTIAATERVAQEQASPFPPGSPQDRMFKQYSGRQGEQKRPAQALGSGFIVSADGQIVTNNHVVDGASKVMVTLDDGRELPARIVGRDARTDLAVLKVEADGPLPHLALGDSDKARVGDWVVAVGNPFGLGGTVTTGIVSARGRAIGAGPYDDFLQVDAAINRGNSGGPLFAQDGTVIGVNTAIFSPTGGSVGIGFAIPSNLVKQVTTQLEANGHVERGFLGASTQPVTAPMAKALGLKKTDGALVAEVTEDSPASRAGLKPGDVITAVGDKAVQTPRDLARTIAGINPGDEAVLTVQRGGSSETLRAKLAELQDKDAPAGGRSAQAENASRDGGPLGLALTPADEGERGAVVAVVRPDSAADKAGLRPGDVIVGVQNRDVANPKAAVKAIKAAEQANKGAVALRVVRDGRTSFLALQAAPDAEQG